MSIGSVRFPIARSSESSTEMVDPDRPQGKLAGGRAAGVGGSGRVCIGPLRRALSRTIIGAPSRSVIGAPSRSVIGASSRPLIGAPSDIPLAAVISGKSLPNNDSSV